MQQDRIAELLRIDLQRAKSLVDADIAFLDQITGANYVHVESTGKLRTKREFLETVAQPDFRFEEFVIDENNVQLYGEIAVLTGRYHNKIRTDLGFRFTKHARHTRVYIFEEGRWLNVAHQATEISVG